MCIKPHYWRRLIDRYIREATRSPAMLRQAGRQAGRQTGSRIIQESKRIVGQH